MRQRKPIRTSVASKDTANKMKTLTKLKSFTLITALLASLLLPACAGSANGERALYIYMCGSNLETENGAATKNIAEMLESSVPAGTTIILETGGAKKWRKYDISSEKLSRYKIEKGNLTLLETVDDANMGSPETLSSFLKYCNEKYPAKYTGVILWDHGNGFKGICNDELHGFDGLTLTELDTAFSDSGKTYDFIGFDACLMANYETARIMSKYAKHMIASEEIEPSGGWDYKSVLSSLGMDSYFADILKAYADKCTGNNKTCYTLSSIDLAGFKSVTESFTEFCKKELSSNATESLQTVDGYAQTSLCFGSNSSSEGRSNLIDLSMFAASNGNSALPEALKKTITCVNGKDRDGAGGLSFYYPFANQKDVGEYLGWSGDDSYKDFLNRFYLGIVTEAAKIAFKNPGVAKNGELSLELTEDSLGNIKNIRYKLYQMVFEGEDVGEKAHCLGYDSDVISEGKGTYTTSFEGKWVKMNDLFVPCEAVDLNGDTTIFSTSVKCNGTEGVIRFSYNGSTKAFSVLGFVPKGENTQGRLHDINDGDKIVILQEVKDENFESTIVETGSFTVDKSINMSVDALPEGYYQLCVVITDLYGTEYRSSTLLAELKSGKLNTIVVTKDVKEG